MQDGDPNYHCQQCKETLENLDKHPMYGICSTGQVGHGPGVVVIDPAKQPQGKEEQEAQKAQIKTILKGWDAMLAATVKPTEAEYAKQRQQFEAMWEAAASREASDADSDAESSDAAATSRQAKNLKRKAENMCDEAAQLEAAGDKGDQ